MAFRTPRPDGLTVAPNATSPPASALELRGHQFWGRYATEAVLPNASGNKAAAPAYDLLRPGDLALAETPSIGETNALYRLVDRGTLGGGDAEWRPIDSNAAAFARRVIYSIGV